MEDLESQVTIECVIEQQHHRTIMGARGANIQKVCSDFNVQIKIPDRKSSNKAQQNGTANDQPENSNDAESSDVIRVSGRKENCEDAVAALKALVPINIEVILIAVITLRDSYKSYRSYSYQKIIIVFRSTFPSNSIDL